MVSMKTPTQTPHRSDAHVSRSSNSRPVREKGTETAPTRKNRESEFWGNNLRYESGSTITMLTVHVLLGNSKVYLISYPSRNLQTNIVISRLTIHVYPTERRIAILNQILEPAAADRLGRIRLVNESRAADIENRLIMLAQTGQLRQKITEEQLKELLNAVAENNRKEEESHKIVINRRKGGWDDDDDDLLNL